MATKFDSYEIALVREYQQGSERFCKRVPLVAVTGYPAGEIAEFWTLYGHVSGEGVTAIGDFKSQEAAFDVLSAILGRDLGPFARFKGLLRHSEQV